MASPEGHPVHDRGGQPGGGAIDRREHQLADWEVRTDALLRVLSSPSRAVMRVDELRRAIESLDREPYESMQYYERWIAAIERLLVDKGVLTAEEIARKEQELEARDATSS